MKTSDDFRTGDTPQEPDNALEASIEDYLSITIPKGTKLLEGVFEGSNGKSYKVTIMEDL